MTRQQWLERFLSLADSGAPAIDYRRKLGLAISSLNQHVARIGDYRRELEELNKLAKIEAIKKLTPPIGDTNGKKEARVEDSKSDRKAMGPRGNSGKE